MLAAGAKQKSGPSAGLGTCPASLDIFAWQALASQNLNGPLPSAECIQYTQVDDPIQPKITLQMLCAVSAWQKTITATFKMPARRNVHSKNPENGREIGHRQLLCLPIICKFCPHCSDQVWMQHISTVVNSSQFRYPVVHAEPRCFTVHLRKPASLQLQGSS